LPPALAPDIGLVETAIIESARTEEHSDCQLILVIGEETHKVCIGRYNL
jgi:hypothetical protein